MEGQPLPEDLKVGDPRAVYYVMANECFKRTAVLLKQGNEEEAWRKYDEYIKMFEGTSENPLHNFTRVAILINSILLRSEAGDPNPNGPPTGTLVGTALGFTKGGESANIPMEEFAVEVISYAANWQFELVEKSMEQKINVAEKDHTSFLPRFIDTLLNIFLSMEGPERFGWV